MEGISSSFKRLTISEKFPEYYYDLPDFFDNFYIIGDIQHPKYERQLAILIQFFECAIEMSTPKTNLLRQFKYGLGGFTKRKTYYKFKPNELNKFFSKIKLNQDSEEAKNFEEIIEPFLLFLKENLGGNGDLSRRYIYHKNLHQILSFEKVLDILCPAIETVFKNLESMRDLPKRIEKLFRISTFVIELGFTDNKISYKVHNSNYDSTPDTMNYVPNICLLFVRNQYFGIYSNTFARRCHFFVHRLLKPSEQDIISIKEYSEIIRIIKLLHSKAIPSLFDLIENCLNDKCVGLQDLNFVIKHCSEIEETTDNFINNENKSLSISREGRNYNVELYNMFLNKLSETIDQIKNFPKAITTLLKPQKEANSKKSFQNKLIVK